MSSIIYDFAEIARRRDEIVNGPKPPKPDVWCFPVAPVVWGNITDIVFTDDGLIADTSILTEEGRKLMEGK